MRGPDAHARPPAGELRLRDLARPLLAVAAANLALLLVWSVVVPTFRGADEHVHHDFLRHLTTTWEYPEYDELPVHQRTVAAIGRLPGQTAPPSPVYQADAPPAEAGQATTDRSARSSWTELGPDIRDYRRNQLAQHPPLYYVPTAAFLRVVDGDGHAPIDRVVWQLRLLNILTLVPLPLLAADLARRFTSSAPVVLSAAAATLAIPQLTHLGATVSNDPLMILLGAVTLSGVARVLTGDRRWATAAVTGVAAGLALFTKGFAVPLVPAVAVAALLPLVPAWRRRHDQGASSPGTGGVLARAAVTGLLALAFGGWWWIRNVVVHGNPQPGVGLRDRVPVDVDVIEFAGSFSSRLVDSFWGNVGWREAHLPLALSAALTVALVVAMAAACWRRWDRLVLVIPPAVAGVMVLAAGWGAYRKTGVSYATQGRYLFTGITGIAALAALGLGRLRSIVGGRLRSVPVAVLAGAAALQAAAILIAVRRYWGGGGLDRLRSLIAFSPLPEVMTAGFLVLAPLALLMALGVVWTDSARGDGAAGRLSHQD